MRHQIIQHNKLCLNKYLLIKNQRQENETMLKVYKLILCCYELKQIKNDIFINIGVRCIF